ncbi:MAG: hypothetical protein LBC85_07525 [Fibromonadaceae bacterium]|nr:hypothetical protein [Fibromonadaceae bacterium]
MGKGKSGEGQFAVKFAGWDLKINGLDFDRQRVIGNYIFLAQRQSHPANLNSKRPSPRGELKPYSIGRQFEILKVDENRG